MPQFDIFGNYALAFLFIILYYVYFFSLVLFMESATKLFYLDFSLARHVFLCNCSKYEKILWTNFIKNRFFHKIIYY